MPKNTDGRRTDDGRTTPKTAFFVDRTFLGSPSKDAPRRVIRAFKIVCFFPREIEVPFKNLPKKELNPVPGKNQNVPVVSSTNRAMKTFTLDDLMLGRVSARLGRDPAGVEADEREKEDEREIVFSYPLGYKKKKKEAKQQQQQQQQQQRDEEIVDEGAQNILRKDEREEKMASIMRQQQREAQMRMQREHKEEMAKMVEGLSYAEQQQDEHHHQSTSTSTTTRVAETRRGERKNTTTRTTTKRFNESTTTDYFATIAFESFESTTRSVAGDASARFVAFAGEAKA